MNISGLRFHSIVLGLLLAAPPALARIVRCDELLLSGPELAAQRIVAERDFEEKRTLQEYEDRLPDEFREAVRRARFWIDAGGGYGTAAHEARFWNPLIRTLNLTKTPEARQGEYHGHENRIGAIEDYARREFKNADLITDIYGAFSYSERPDMILQRFNEWLSQDGVAYLHFRDHGYVQVGGLRMSLSDWVIKRSGLNCRRLETAMECRRVPGVRVPVLELIETHDGAPPFRGFKEVPDEDLQPNVKREIFDDQGEPAGHFDAHLSRDGEVLSEVYFYIKKKKQGYSRRIVEDLLRQFPKINEIRAALILDNSDAFNLAKDQGMSDSSAFAATPFAKVFAPFGFNDAELSMVSRSGVDVVLRPGLPLVKH